MIWWGKIVGAALREVTAINCGPGFDDRDNGGGREVG